MLTFSNLTKTLASGSLALGVATFASVSSALFVAPSAQAAFFGTVGELLDAGEVIVGDKIFYDFSFGGITEGDVLIDVNTDNEDFGDIWTFVYYASFNPSEGGLTEGTYTINYSVDILSPPALSSTTFDSVLLGALFGGIEAFAEPSFGGFTVTKDVLPNVGDPISLFVDDDFGDFGSIIGATSLNITDTIEVAPGGLFGAVANGYTQTPQSVPEPGAILGLLAVGGLGLVSRFTKQK